MFTTTTITSTNMLNAGGNCLLATLGRADGKGAYGGGSWKWNPPGSAWYVKHLWEH
jgi:hypothetical protein